MSKIMGIKIIIYIINIPHKLKTFPRLQGGIGGVKKCRVVSSKDTDSEKFENPRRLLGAGSCCFSL